MSDFDEFGDDAFLDDLNVDAVIAARDKTTTGTQPCNDNGSIPFKRIKLNPKAREATIQSTTALKNFAMNRDKCRRKSLLEFFAETAKFGDWCGNCDVCCNRTKFGDDATRDFGEIARFILHGVNSLAEQGLTMLLQEFTAALAQKKYNQAR